MNQGEQVSGSFVKGGGSREIVQVSAQPHTAQRNATAWFLVSGSGKLQ